MGQYLVHKPETSSQAVVTHASNMSNSWKVRETKNITKYFTVGHIVRMVNKADSSLTTVLVELTELEASANLKAAENSQRNDKKQLETGQLQEVYSALLEAENKWDNFGLALGIAPHKITNIGSDFPNNQKRLREMLTHWLESSSSRTWTDISKALRSKTVELNALAEHIEKTFVSEYRLTD